MSLLSKFNTMKEAYNHEPNPTLVERIALLVLLKKGLLLNKDQLYLALNEDFGQRSVQDSILELLPSINNINYTIEQLEKWLTPSPRHPGALLEASSSVDVIYQPKGVVAIISTWNAPIMVTINPLTAALASGNRVMIKLSEFTPHFNKALKAVFAEIFTQGHVQIIEGEADIAAEFSSLPFDHLLFTGSTQVGRLVMKSAATNLTPVTLELGGKSPVLIDDTADFDKIIERIVIAKNANSGQLCIAPDYVLLPEDKLTEFCEKYIAQYQLFFPQGVESSDMTACINDRQFNRILSYLEDAKAKSLQVISCHEKAVNNDRRLMATHLVVNPTDNDLVMQEEIFGPILPIVTYKTIEQALDVIQNKPRPLALYLMSEDKTLQHFVKNNIHSGGMCINDAVFHASVDDAPFGGSGDSGIGSYHGFEGFQTFSHAKTVLTTGDASNVKYMFTPGDNDFKTAIGQMLSV